MKNFCCLLFFIFFVSCSSKQQENNEIVLKKEKSSISVKHNASIALKKEFKKELENWKEYQIAEEFSNKFINTSPNEALSNALEFKDLISNLKDSIKPVIFNTPSFNARINLLKNEAERLADITFISAIKTAEVNHQVDKMLKAFSALNSKINTVLSQKKFEEAIEIDAVFIGLDSTKIDSISRKSIKAFDKKTKDEKRKRELEKLPSFKGKQPRKN